MAGWQVRQSSKRTAALRGWYETANRSAPEDRMNLGVMMLGYNGPLSSLPIKAPPSGPVKFPVLISLAGCGWGDDTVSLPPNIAVLTAGERLPNRQWAAIDACNRHDVAALERTYKNELSALLKAARSRRWFDPDRVIIRGYGEAAPVVAAYDGPALARIVAGEPCLTPWRAIATRTPLTVLRSALPWQLWRAAIDGSLPTRCMSLPRPPALVAATDFVDPLRLDSYVHSTAFYDALGRAYAGSLSGVRRR